MSNINFRDFVNSVETKLIANKCQRIKVEGSTSSNSFSIFKVSTNNEKLKYYYQNSGLPKSLFLLEKITPNIVYKKDFYIDNQFNSNDLTGYNINISSLNLGNQPHTITLTKERSEDVDGYIIRRNTYAIVNINTDTAKGINKLAFSQLCSSNDAYLTETISDDLYTSPIPDGLDDSLNITSLNLSDVSFNIENDKIKLLLDSNNSFFEYDSQLIKDKENDYVKFEHDGTSYTLSCLEPATNPNNYTSNFGINEWDTQTFLFNRGLRPLYVEDSSITNPYFEIVTENNEQICRIVVPAGSLVEEVNDGNQ